MNPIRIKPRQAVRPEMAPQTGADEGQALAIAELARGPVVCCFRWSGAIRATVSDDAGVSWNGSLEAAADVAADAAPCLVLDPWERLQLWYHDASGVRARVTVDGKAWADHAGPFSLGTHPAVAADAEGLAMVCCSDGGLDCYRSGDRGVGWEKVGSIAGIPRQRASLLVDRNGHWQLYSRGAGQAVERRGSPDGVHWTDPQTILAAGNYPVAANWAGGRVLLCWSGGTLLYHTLGGDGVSPGAPLSAPSGLRAGYLGLNINRHGVAWMAGFAGDTMRRYCAYPGGTWQFVV